MLGLIAAAVSSAVALRRLRGTTTPYALPVALAVLKLPTGMLTAVLGLLLMRGDFVPGLSALDTPSQILAWAVLFGYAQQLFTRFVDERAHSVLDQVGAPDHTGGPEAAMVTRAAPVALDGGNGAPPPPPRRRRRERALRRRRRRLWLRRPVTAYRLAEAGTASACSSAASRTRPTPSRARRWA